ncbi:hypothetical protein C8R44DRAFT_754075 [Mycena epipterygia]|nr:hypothetical protein C8R44DRAFT_754075 [Mycena epipterygia]
MAKEKYGIPVLAEPPHNLNQISERSAVKQIPICQGMTSSSSKIEVAWSRRDQIIVAYFGKCYGLIQRSYCWRTAAARMLENTSPVGPALSGDDMGGKEAHNRVPDLIRKECVEYRGLLNPWWERGRGPFKHCGYVGVSFHTGFVPPRELRDRLELGICELEGPGSCGLRNSPPILVDARLSLGPPRVKNLKLILPQ